MEQRSLPTCQLRLPYYIVMSVFTCYILDYIMQLLRSIYHPTTEMVFSCNVAYLTHLDFGNLFSFKHTLEPRPNKFILRSKGVPEDNVTSDQWLLLGQQVFYMQVLSID